MGAPIEEEESLEQEAAGSKPWSRSDGKAVSHFFYKNKLAHAHLCDHAVMPGESVAPNVLQPEILQRISPACAALMVRRQACVVLFSLLFYLYVFF